MKTINILIICVTIFLLIGGFIYAIYDYEKSKGPYKQCLDKCDIVRFDSRHECMENCNDVFEKIALDFFDKFENVLNKLLEDSQ